MKQESDRQLKAQWDAATLKDFDFEIDTEKLWQKIDKPGARRQLVFTGLKYAAAVVSGAVLTLFITQLNPPKEVAMKSLIEVRELTNEPAIREQAGKQPGNVIHQNRSPVAVAVKSNPLTGQTPAATQTSLAKTPKIATALNNYTPPEQNSESLLAPVNDAAPNTIAREAPKAALKTVHLFDLEKPAPEPAKPSKFMMAIGEHTNPKSNDIAFSTKILTKQF